MILDSSALVAILRREPECLEFLTLVDEAGRVAMSAVSLLETSIVVTGARHAEVDAFVDERDIEILAFDHEHANAAREAYQRFGRRSGSPARLNFGDCATYATAALAGEPLLFKGDDFTHTDVVSALAQEPLGDETPDHG